MNQVVFLVDVDNTLLDNDHIQADIKTYLERHHGAACRDRYWAILEALFTELGYRDYLGALQRYRVEHPQDMQLLSMSSFLVDYPFANRLYRDRWMCPNDCVSGAQPFFSPMATSFFNRAGLSAPVCRRRWGHMC